MNTDLKKEELKALPRKNSTSFAVLKGLSEMQRNRHETNIDGHQMKLLYQGVKIDPNLYMQVWKDLEAIGAGIIVWGRNGNPSRFKWYYSLKDIGTEAVTDVSNDIQPLKESSVAPKRRYKRRSKRGRPLGSKNKTRNESESSYEGIAIPVKDVNGNTSNISLEEAVRVADQVSRIKQLAKAA